jgi:hypothetical protein
MHKGAFLQPFLYFTDDYLRADYTYGTGTGHQYKTNNGEESSRDRRTNEETSNLVSISFFQF